MRKPKVASTSVCSAGAPLETKYAVVKSPMVHSVESSVLIRYRLASSGNVTKVKRRMPVAPSTSAAS